MLFKVVAQKHACTIVTEIGIRLTELRQQNLRLEQNLHYMHARSGLHPHAHVWGRHAMMSEKKREVEGGKVGKRRWESGEIREIHSRGMLKGVAIQIPREGVG